LNKLLRLSSLILVLSMVAILASIFFLLNLEVSLSIAYTAGLLFSGFVSLLDGSNIDLFYVLRAFALFLFTIASLILVVKILQRKKFLTALVSLIAQGVLAGLLLTSSSVFYPEFPSQGVSESFLDPVITALGGTLLSNRQYLLFGSLTFFVFIFLLHHIFILVSFVAKPVVTTSELETIPTKSNNIAEELSRFVIPSILTPVVPASMKPETQHLPSSPSETPVLGQDRQVTNSVLTAPAYTLPIMMQDPNYQSARLQVDDIKERIRKAIRLELEKQKDLFVEEQQPEITPLPPQTFAETKPLPEVSLNNQTFDIQNKVKDIIESQLSTLEPKTKEMVAYLINEELIKYDALNREVLETFIQEKIQSTTSDAIESLRQELSTVYEEKIQSLTAQKQTLPSPSTESEEIAPVTPVQATAIDEILIHQWVNTAIENHPLVKLIQVPQQESPKPLDVDQLKKEIMDSIKEDASLDNNAVIDQSQTVKATVSEEDIQKIKDDVITSLSTEAHKMLPNTEAMDIESIKLAIVESLKADGLLFNKATIVSEEAPIPINKEDLEILKQEIIASLRQQTNMQIEDQPKTQGAIDTLDKVGIIEVIDDYLSHHNLFKDGFSTIIPPTITLKKARAPKNVQRAEQFKTVVPIEQGMTRTGKKKIIRIPFYQRMATAHASLTSQYDELKNYILAFKVKSRLSNTGDTFRLHKEEFIKITLAGKSLKLYFALNPKSYDDTSIPVDDVGDKKMYRDMPLMFKVKSNLSLKRAKILIDDLMKSKDLAQKAIGSIQWSLQFKNF